jgi:hypothetical protein
MKANIFRKSLVAVAAVGAISALSTSSQAADQILGFSFDTIADVSIDLVTGLDIGGNIKLALNSTCTLLLTNAGGITNPSSLDARVPDGVGFAIGTNYGGRDGDCDDGTLGVPGKYVIRGAEGVPVTIDVNGIAPGAGNFSFTPIAVAADHNSVTADDSVLDLLVTTGRTATGTVTLARSTDLGNGGSPIPGESFLYVGGTINTEIVLTAGTIYNGQQFVVDVIY